MAITHTITTKWSNGSAVKTMQKAITSEQEINTDISVPGASTDLHIVLDITIARLKSIVLLATRDMTVCTNAASGGGPDETIPLLAGKPFIWDSVYVAALCPVPFANDITDLYITLAAGAAATLSVFGLVDATP